MDLDEKELERLRHRFRAREKALPDTNAMPDSKFDTHVIDQKMDCIVGDVKFAKMGKKNA